MNVYDAMGRIVDYAIAYLDIVPDTAASNEDVAAVCKMLDAYDALAPEWTQAPEWAQWYAIDADGINHFYQIEPRKHDRAFWVVSSGKYSAGKRIAIPDNIDWRLCKWQRPEVTA